MVIKFTELEEAKERNFTEAIRIASGEADAKPELRHLQALADKLVKVLAASKYPDTEEVKDAVEEEFLKAQSLGAHVLQEAKEEEDYKSPCWYHLWNHYLHCSSCCRPATARHIVFRCNNCAWGHKEELTNKDLVRLTETNQLKLGGKRGNNEQQSNRHRITENSRNNKWYY